MNVADLGPLRDHDTRWVVAGAVAWGDLDICLGLFGGLFLLRAGGGLLSAALWLLPLGFALGVVFLSGRHVFARVGTRPFRLASPVGAMVVAVAFAPLGARAAEPPITVLLSAIWALTQGRSTGRRSTSSSSGAYRPPAARRTSRCSAVLASSSPPWSRWRRLVRRPLR